jgi:aryl-alcohol dehydrogenase-like predicted oxidoreductase
VLDVAASRASKLPQLDEAVAALAIRLDADEVALLDAPCQPHAILGHS